MRMQSIRLANITRTFGFALRVLAAWLILAGPVYGVSQVQLESTATFNSGAGFVLLSALQRARN